MNKVEKDSSRRHTDYRMTSSTQATGVAYWIWCWLRWIILENDFDEFVMSVGRQVSSKLTLLGEGHRQCRDGRALQSRSWGQTSGGGEEKMTMYWMKLNVFMMIRWSHVKFCLFSQVCSLADMFPRLEVEFGDVTTVLRWPRPTSPVPSADIFLQPPNSFWDGDSSWSEALGFRM